MLKAWKRRQSDIVKTFRFHAGTGTFRPLNTGLIAVLGVLSILLFTACRFSICNLYGREEVLDIRVVGDPQPCDSPKAINCSRFFSLLLIFVSFRKEDD